MNSSPVQIQDRPARIARIQTSIAWAHRAVRVLIIAGLASVIPAARSWSDGTINVAGFGDAVAGTAGVLWGLAALGMIFATFGVQQQQMLLQEEALAVSHKELANSVAEMREQTAAFREQNKTLVAQRFEDAFFQLLGAHEAFSRELVVKHGAVELAGRMIFARACELMDHEMKAAHFYKDEKSLGQAVAFYHVIHRQFDSVLGPYFRSLYQLISWVDSSVHGDLSPTDRRRYTNIVRARLSEDELLIFFYNLASDHGRGFIPLVLRYDLLQHLPKHRLVHPGHIDSLASLSAA